MNSLQACVSMQAWISKAAYTAVVPGKWMLTQLWGAATEDRGSIVSKPYVLAPLAYVSCATAAVLPLLAVGVAGCTAPVYAAVVGANRWRTNLTPKQLKWLLHDNKVADALVHLSGEHMLMLLDKLRQLYIVEGAFFGVATAGGGASESSRSLVAQLGLMKRTYARHDKDNNYTWHSVSKASICRYLVDNRERNQGKRLYYCLYMALHALLQEPFDTLIQVASLPPPIASMVLGYW
jgi:hypothetical protein